MNWKFAILSIGVFVVLIACNGQSEKMSEHQHKQEKVSTVEKTYYYTCPWRAINIFPALQQVIVRNVG